MSFRTVKVLCCVMLLVFPASVVLAESRAAMAMASGVAALNGSALSRSAAIFAGDQLETGANSAITISANGSTVLVGANSRLHYFGDSVELHLGTTQVSTTKGMKLETDTVSAEPNKGGTGKYRVDRAEHTVVIAALSDELRVNNNGESTVLEPGSTMTLKEKDYDDSQSPVKGPSNRKIFVVVAIATGAAAAILWATDHEKKPISNQIP